VAGISYIHRAYEIYQPDIERAGVDENIVRLYVAMDNSSFVEIVPEQPWQLWGVGGRLSSLPLWH
jgi:hypothetical protein